VTGDALRDQMIEQLETSLRLLQTDHVEIWQIHNVDDGVLAQQEELAMLFEEVKQSGKVRFVGGSFYGVDLPLAALRADLFDVYQITYSVLDQRASDRFFDAAAEKNAGIVARSVLLKGALTDRAEYLPERLAPLRARSRRFRQLVAESEIGLTPAQAAIAFAVMQKNIHSVLIGVSSEAELQENLSALEYPLPGELLDSLYGLRLDDADLLNPGTWAAK
jgi:aryl-alcohol dehydrogenase-like predicted oxidoreductase